MTQGPSQSSVATGGLASDEAIEKGGDPALLGRTIAGKYKIEKFLGGGAMGAVYKARFAALEKNVAVKVMHPAIAVDPNFVGRFHREAKAASRLDHPNSMRVIDFGEEPDGVLYIAMEYVEGRDLYRVIHEDWPISNADVGDILMQALAAIAVAHEMGVIHRDLKPENLMILRAKNDEEKDAYVVKVCDFGIAKITERDEEPKSEGGPGGQKLTTQGLVVGTPEYMSPEQARGEKLDARSDIYSIGVILYQLLTGRTPFSGETPLAVVLKHITENPSPPSVHYAGVHKGLEAVCLRALAKDRAERWQSARAMRNAIREALVGRPMPVDVAADTVAGIAGPGGLVASTTPAVSGPMIVTQGVTSAGAGDVSPTVAGGLTASHLTPLGTAAATAGMIAPKKSRAGLGIALGAVALVVVGGAIAAPRVLHALHQRGGDPGTITPVTSVVVTTATPSASTPSTTSSAVTTEPPPAPSPTDAKSAKPTGRTSAAAKTTAEAPPPSTAVVAVPPTPPTPEPPPVAPTPPPVAPTPPPVAPAPAFNPATCRATSNGVRSNGSVSTKDLSMGGTVAAWTGCAQRSIRDKPAQPIVANVHLAFSDNKAFRGATCTGCPAPLAACIASSTGRTVSLTFKGGDVTGEPAFDVGVTFSCD